MRAHRHGSHARPGRTSRALRTVPLAVLMLPAVLTAGAAPSLAAGTPPSPPSMVSSSPPGSPRSSGFSAEGRQWYHETLGLTDAQQLTLGEGVIVAIIDGGVDATHPKLRGQLLPGYGIGPDAAPDGLRDDDPDGHGTAMAGIVAARADVGDPSVWGVAPKAKILPISTGAEADSEEVARAIRIAVDRGAGVISMSLGSVGEATSREASAVRYALAHDVVVVASAGNTEPGDTEVNSPANIPGVIAVTGSDYRGRFWGGSVQGPEAVLAAPGPGIRAPVPVRVSSDGLDTGGGTSNSAAIVAGVAALVRSELSGLDGANVVNRLIRTALDMGPPGRDDRYGFGLVDPVAALTADIPRVAANPLLAAPAPRPATALDDPTAAPGTPPGQRADEPAEAAEGSDGPSIEVWLLMLGLAVVEGVLLGTLAYMLFGDRFAARRARRRGRTPAPVHTLTNNPLPGQPLPRGTLPVPPAWPVPPPGPLAPAPPSWQSGRDVPVDTRGWRTPH
ncbi:S8 family serine peptidase [Parafrankia elaeagni]|uniref:S8 family serine peptidase n=1 Tax=Parafrankia elaeagni TaxID=222534 RepID=UPI00039A0998|nr:S8 family serine peptidase [Parafrankia elaeagni]